MNRQPVCQFPGRPWKAEYMNKNQKSQWFTPTLVGKQVSQTLSGLGSNYDARGGEVHS